MKRHEADFTFEDWIVLCHMAADPEQRIVRQYGSAPGEDGWQVFGSSVYFRTMGRDVPPRRFLGLRRFRKLSDAGWIVPAADSLYRYGDQLEFVLSEASIHRFGSSPRWMLELRRWSSLCAGVA